MFVWAMGRLARLQGHLGSKPVVRFTGDDHDMVVSRSDVLPVPEELASRIGEPAPLAEAGTRRPVSPGAERWLGVPIRVLDHGFVSLVDYMGTDESVVRAARVSTGTGSRGVEDDRRLIRYLRRHGHTSPFEHVEVAFHVKLPIFVARQWVRHRTAHLNERSGRYTEFREDESFTPAVEDIGGRDTANRQGRGPALPEPKAQEARELIASAWRGAYRVYWRLLELGVAREIARVVLPVATYTEWYWKIDLHNLLHFLHLRMDPHAQKEIREYAAAISRIVRDGWPLAWEAFEDFTLGQVSFSRAEVETMRLLGISVEPETVERVCDATGITGGERREFVEKLRRAGIIDG